MVPFIFNVHLVKAPLSGLVLDSDGAILVVGDVWPGRFPGWHPHLTYQMTVWIWDETITTKPNKRRRYFFNDCRTSDFSLLWREGHQEVDGAEERIHSITGNNWLVGGLWITRRDVFLEFAFSSSPESHPSP